MRCGSRHIHRQRVRTKINLTSEDIKVVRSRYFADSRLELRSRARTTHWFVAQVPEELHLIVQKTLPFEHLTLLTTKHLSFVQQNCRKPNQEPYERPTEIKVSILTIFIIPSKDRCLGRASCAIE